MTGRYAPSPTGRLHLGNLRTALLAWCFARSAGGSFLLRVEDLDRDRSRAEHESGQLADLRAIGIDWDGEVVRQSERSALYEEAAARLDTYPCFCTRAEIREASSAPHGAVGPYPGTCASLTAERVIRHMQDGRPPAMRVRAGGATVSFEDRLAGYSDGLVDDFVIRRNDGAWAYNLAVVVDDGAQGVQQVVRGSDLLDSTPRQLWLARALGLPEPSYAHVPLVLGPDGTRLAKRHGAVTLGDGIGTPEQVRSLLARSLGLAVPGEQPSMAELAQRFHPDRITSEPWILAL